MKEFKARSGREVKVFDNGHLAFDHGKGYLDAGSVMDAEEYFQAKSDTDRGRWRWPENPSYVVYPKGGGSVIAFSESSGRSLEAVREQAAMPGRDGSILLAAAHAYFEAHPEPKPWADAQYGEVWQVTHTGGEVVLCRVSSLLRFEQVSGTDHLVSFPVAHSSIAAAHRVFPEVAS